MVSKLTSRSFCVEARNQTTPALYAWPAFWQYGSASGNDQSELDFEQPITANQGVNDVTMHNHPSEGANLQIYNSDFTTPYMNFHSSGFNASTGVHSYTSCCNDATKQKDRYIDGSHIYSVSWTWNQSLGGTGRGPDAAAILNMAVGGNWPGNTPNPNEFSADFNVYSVRYYAP